MNVIKCDVCGAIFGSEYYGSGVYRPLFSSIRFINDAEYEDPDYNEYGPEATPHDIDLCPKCTEEILKYVDDRQAYFRVLKKEREEHNHE